MNRDELVALVRKFIDEGPDAGEQCEEWLSQLQDQVPDPQISDYIFWPDRKMSAEEIVDRALAYKPRRLPP
jgi:hypothetical protein